MISARPPGAWGRIFLPFALGYYLSYLLRSVNAVISPALSSELGLSAADLGLLTSAYFLAFGLMQIPIGIALDRYGPRRVEGSLLLLSALGGAAFACGDSLATLGLARGLLGVGVSACLMAGLKGFAMWYPPERQASMTGFIMAAGALGALTASAPLESLLPLTGWRGLFWLITACALLASAWIFLSLPDEAPHAGQDTLAVALASVGRIFRSRDFLRYGVVATFFTGGFMALQGLWVVPWLMHVGGLDLAAAARHLLVLNLGMLAGQLGMGLAGTLLARRGIRSATILRVGYAGMLVVELGLLSDVLPPGAAWGLFGVFSAVNSQSYLAAAGHFPPAQFGRVSTAVNLMAFAGAFAVQWGMGLALDGLQYGGYAMDAALKITFGGLLVLQFCAYLPLLRARRPRA